jgi:hypothetical protein
VTTVTKYRIAIALLWGFGLTSLLCLLMNLSWSFGLFLLPGGVGAFAVGSLVFRRAGLLKLRRIAGWSVPPAIVLAVLACFPSMNPLWPHGMTELAKQESELQAAIPVGMSLDQARGVLNAKNIRFDELTEPNGGLVLQAPQATITALSGDIVLSSRIQTDAFSFPCGYDMRIILLFGRDRNLRQRYIRRFMICP